MLYSIPMREYALAAIRLIWPSYFSEECTSTPKSQTVLASENVVLLLVYCTDKLLKPRCRTRHLSACVN